MPRILATQATMPPMPAGGFTPPPLDQYLKALIMSLNDDRVKVGDRIERRVLYGPTSGFPTARGGGDLYYDTTVGDLYIDTGTWDLVFSTVPAHTHSEYLPLTAGDTKPLTGSLYLDKTSQPTLYLREGGSTTDYSWIQMLQWNLLAINHTVGVGGSFIRLDPLVTDGVSDVWIQLFRKTDTTGEPSFRIYKGNDTATIQHEFQASTGNVNLCQQSGTIQQDGVNVSLVGHSHDDLYYTESEVDALLHPQSHTIASHSDTSATGSELNTLTGGGSTTLHAHAYAPVSHTHDTRYYTEGEIDTLLGAYVPIAGNSGNPMTGDLWFNYLKTIVLKEAGGLQRGLAYIDSTDVMRIGDVNGDTMIRCQTWIKINGGYLDLDGNAVYMGGGAINTENGAVNMGTGNVVGAAGCKLVIDSMDFCQSLSSQRIFGYTSGVSWFEGGNCRMYGPYKSGTADPPGTAQFSAASWGIYVNTSNSKCWLCYNHGGAMRRIELT